MRIDSVILHSVYNYNYILKPIKNFHAPTTNFNINTHFNMLSIDYTNVNTMALMSYNAYLELNDTNWEKVPYNTTKPINNEIDNVKGIFINNINIIAIKRTSINFVPFTELSNEYYTFNQESFSSLDTVKNDRFNDNMFFSCCYYKQSKDYIDYLEHCGF